MSERKKTPAQVLREIADSDPVGHGQRLARAYGAGPEPTVQVPVSLIEGLLDDYGSRRAQAELDAYALLSQPTPTAEPTSREGYDRYLEEYTSETEVPMSLAEWRKASAAPPSIADMVPGTTFLANPRGWTNPAHWVVVQDGRAVSTDSWRWCTQGDIDPSTIRDVTPPTNG